MFDNNDDSEFKTVFLVEGKLTINYYMVDEPKVTTVKNLVVAVNEEEARSKFIQHYESKSSDYEVDYYVSNVDVLETII